MAFRLMHLHGRAFQQLVPKAVDRSEDYEWMEGELMAGLVLGWNFGEGHLHNEQLLRSVQAQCQFEEGELRCIFWKRNRLESPRKNIGSLMLKRTIVFRNCRRSGTKETAGLAGSLRLFSL